MAGRVPIPTPHSNAELLDSLEIEISEKKNVLEKVTKRWKAVIGPFVPLLAGTLAFFGSNSLSSSEILMVMLIVGVAGPMVFASPIVIFKSEYLRRRLRKVPQWLFESLWSSYMTLCGLAFLFFALTMIGSGFLFQSELPSLFLTIDLVFIGLVSATSFAMAARAFIRKKGREDAQSTRQDLESTLESRSTRLAYSAVIGMIVYILPIGALLDQPSTILSLQAALILSAFCPLLLWSILGLLYHQEYFVYIDRLEEVKKRAEAEGAKSFERNVLAFTNILQYGNPKRPLVRKSGRNRDRRKRTVSSHKVKRS